MGFLNNVPVKEIASKDFMGLKGFQGYFTEREMSKVNSSWESKCETCINI